MGIYRVQVWRWKGMELDGVRLVEIYDRQVVGLRDTMRMRRRTLYT